MSNCTQVNATRECLIQALPLEDDTFKSSQTVAFRGWQFLRLEVMSNVTGMSGEFPSTLC